MVVPLLVVLVGILTMGAITTYFTRDSLLTEMRENGFNTSRQLIQRLEENTMSLEVVNAMLDDKIKTTAETVKLNIEDLSNNYLMQLALASEVAEINYFDAGGEIQYSSNRAYVGYIAPQGHMAHEFMASSDPVLIEEIRQDTESHQFIKYGYVKAGHGAFVQVGISADRVQELTEGFEYQVLLEEIASTEEIAYALLIDTNFKAIAHSNLDRIGMVFDDEASVAAVVDSVPYAHQRYYEPEDVNVYDITYPVVVGGENIGALSIGYSMTDINQSIRTNIIITIITGLWIFAVLALVLYRASNYAVKIVNRLKEQMNVLASGDFSQEIPEDLLAKKDEFGEISQAVSSMQSAIKDILKNVIEAAQQLAASSQQLTATSEQSATAADEVAKVIEDIAQGASDQAKETEQGVLATSVLGDLVVENTNNMENLNRATGQVIDLKDEGLEILEELVDKTAMNSQSSKEVQKIIQDTNESAGKIASASEMIGSIADQTNLLALNAAIEAARAGEAGRGFAVVADEIRQLAEQSTQFTGEIKTIITDLTEKTLEAVSTMDALEKVVLSQSESVEMTSNKFDGIAQAIEESRSVIGIISSSSEEMGNKKEDIVDIMEQLSAISQENAAGTQEAAASVEEQTASTQEIAHSSEDLAKIAEELNERVRQFTI